MVEDEFLKLFLGDLSIQIEFATMELVEGSDFVSIVQLEELLIERVGEDDILVSSGYRLEDLIFTVLFSEVGKGNFLLV